MLKAYPPISAAPTLYGCRKSKIFIYLPAFILAVLFCFSSCMAQDLRCVEKISPYYKEGIFTDLEHVEKIIAEQRHQLLEAQLNDKAREAASLALEHPTKHETLRFSAPPPRDGAWRAFDGEIHRWFEEIEA